MELTVLISEAKNLINQAQDKAGFNRPDKARAHLVKLRELLNNEPVLDEGKDSELEQKLNPDDE